MINFYWDNNAPNAVVIEEFVRYYGGRFMRSNDRIVFTIGEVTLITDDTGYSNGSFGISVDSEGKLVANEYDLMLYFRIVRNPYLHLAD